MVMERNGVVELCLLIVLFCAGSVSAQEEVLCYGAGSIVLSVVLTLLCVTLLSGIVYLIWRKYKQRKGKLMIRNMSIGCESIQSISTKYIQELKNMTRNGVNISIFMCRWIKPFTFFNADLVNSFHLVCSQY